MTSTPSLDDLQKLVVFVGRRTGMKNIVYGYFDLAHADNWEAHLRYYAKPLVSNAEVGVTILLTIPADAHDTFYIGGSRAPKIVGYWDEGDKTTLLAWEVADRAAYERKSQSDAAKRIARNASQLDKHILALEEGARDLSLANRIAFARYVEQKIRGGLF